MKHPVSITIVLLGILMGCSDEPNSVGVGLLPRLDGLRVDSLQVTAITSSNYRTNVTGTSTIILLGKYSTMEARTLLQFTGFPTTRMSSTVDSAVLSLTIASRFLDTSGTLAFEVHRITRSWAEGSLNWDSLTPGNLYSDTIDARFNLAISPSDSVLRLRIDSVAAHWLRDGNSSPYGIILLPTVSIQPVVIGLRNFDLLSGALFPELKIAYHDSLGPDSLDIRASQGFFAGNAPAPAPPTRIYLQGGVAYRGKLLFDVASLPKNASITSAALEVHIDPALSLLNAYSRDSLIANFLPDSSKIDSLQLATLGVPAVSGNMFTFDIRNIVQGWVIGRPNQGIVLRAYGETWTFDRFACYDAFATAALRPRLRIKYTVLP